MRASGDGNLRGVLTGDPLGGSLEIGEGQGFVTVEGHDDWPITANAVRLVDACARTIPYSHPSHAFRLITAPSGPAINQKTHATS